jgi:hypothetical protein
VNLGVIVEGHGESEALPMLVRRVAHWLDPALDLQVVPPYRLPKGRMVKEPEIARAVELVARKAGPAAPILVLLDADEDAACELGPRLLGWARAARSDREIGVVVAVREYEAWFLAAARSLSSRRGLPADLTPVEDPERNKNPKRWLEERMAQGYTETLDQPALTECMDLAEARRADSFDKLVRDVARLLGRAAPPR